MGDLLTVHTTSYIRFKYDISMIILVIVVVFFDVGDIHNNHMK